MIVIIISIIIRILEFLMLKEVKHRFKGIKIFAYKVAIKSKNSR